MKRQITITARLVLGGVLIVSLPILIFFAMQQSYQVLETKNSDYAYYNDLHTSLVQFSSDHLDWIYRMRGAVENDFAHFANEDNDRTCTLGRFLYGPDLQLAIARDPEMESKLEAVRKSHQQLHASVRDIKAVWVKRRSGLRGSLESIMLGYWSLFQKASYAVFTGQPLSQQDLDSGWQLVEKNLSLETVKEFEKVDAKFGKNLTEFRHLAEELSSLFSKLNLGLVSTDDGQATSIFFEEVVFRIVKLSSVLEPAAKRATELENESTKALDVFEGVAVPAMKELRGGLGAVIEIAEKNMVDAREEFSSQMRTSTTWQAVYSGVAVLLTIGLFIGLGVSVARPLRRIMGLLSGSAQQVENAALALVSIGSEFSTAANQQAKGLQETSSALEELASSGSLNNSAAQQVAEVATEVNQQVGDSSLSMSSMSSLMGEIRAAAVETTRIIQTIDSIAFQTNLLALNAAVEAARAGDAGRSFSVVADEVRSLAQRSAEAAKNTSKLLETSKKLSDDGVKVVKNAEKMLSSASEGVQRVTKMMGEVATATSEQMDGLFQVTGAVMDIDQVVQGSANNARSLADSANEMSGQAVELISVVGLLGELLGVRGPRSSSAPKIDIDKSAGDFASNTQQVEVCANSQVVNSGREAGNSDGLQIPDFSDEDFRKGWDF